MDQQSEKLAAFAAGKLYDAWTVLGSHPVAEGTEFAVWAPNARSVAVTGDFCGWDGAGIPLSREDGGIWRGFLPQAREWTLYKYIVEGSDGIRRWKSDPYALSGEGAYSKQFGKTELRTGLQYQHNFAENQYTLYGTTTSMTKDNAYLYAELQGGIGSKVNYSVGTGAKMFNVTDGVNSLFYLRNLSTARLQWRIDQQWSLTALSQFTPNLPSLSSLSPVFQQTDDVEGQQGNPNLKPSEFWLNRLRLRWSHPEGWYINGAVGYGRWFHPMVQTYAYDPSRDLFIRTLQNADHWQALFANANMGVQGLWQCLNLSLFWDYGHYTTEGENFSHTRDNFTTTVNAKYYWKSLVVGASFTLLPEWQLYGEDYTMSEMEQSIYVQYRWKSLTAMLMWHCPFNPDGYRYETIGLSAVHPYRHTNWTANNSNMLVLGLTWQMDFGKQYRKGEKTLQNGGYDNGMVK